VTSNSVTLTWTSGNTETVQSYIIQYKAEYSSDEYSSIKTVMTTQYNVSLLKANTAYEFRIVAVNDAGQSQPSVTKHVSTSKGRLIRLAEFNISCYHPPKPRYCFDDFVKEFLCCTIDHINDSEPDPVFSLQAISTVYMYVPIFLKRILVLLRWCIQAHMVIISLIWCFATVLICFMQMCTTASLKLSI